VGKVLSCITTAKSVSVHYAGIKIKASSYLTCKLKMTALEAFINELGGIDDCRGISRRCSSRE